MACFIIFTHVVSHIHQSSLQKKILPKSLVKVNPNISNNTNNPTHEGFFRKSFFP